MEAGGLTRWQVAAHAYKPMEISVPAGFEFFWDRVRKRHLQLPIGRAKSFKISRGLVLNDRTKEAEQPSTGRLPMIAS